jgi:hypothetical protein
MFLKYIYIVFIGILLATFIGVGIQAFYPPPKAPQNPVAPIPYPLTATPSAQTVQKDNQYSNAWQDFQTKREVYDKNVSIIATAAAIILLTLSITILQKTALIADGMLLGGVLTEVYGIFRGFTSGDDKVRFLIVTTGLVVALFLGYKKFSKTAR